MANLPHKFNDPALYGTKFHFAYDQLNRLVEQYSGPYDMAHQAPCWKTIYAYDGDNLVATQDIYTEWDSAWDID